MEKNTSVKIVIFSLLLLIWYSVGLISSIPKTPKAAMRDFYEREVAEDQIMDPLILAGDGVAPLLEEKIGNSDMPNRRYAIGALGNLKSRSSLAILKRLAQKTSEIDYIRCDALAAIGMIDRREGIVVWNSIRKEGLECLSGVNNANDYSQWLQLNSPRRSYLVALLGWHN